MKDDRGQGMKDGRGRRMKDGYIQRIEDGRDGQEMKDDHHYGQGITARYQNVGHKLSIVRFRS